MAHDEECKGLDMDCDEVTLITLVCDDGHQIDVDKKVLSVSKMLTSILDVDQDTTVVNIKLDKAVAEKMVEYMTYIVDKDPCEFKKPLVSYEKECDEWHLAYSDHDRWFIQKLMVAADYLNIESLIQFMAAKIASFIAGKSREEIRAFVHAKEPE